MDAAYLKAHCMSGVAMPVTLEVESLWQVFLDLSSRDCSRFADDQEARNSRDAQVLTAEF